MSLFFPLSLLYKPLTPPPSPSMNQLKWEVQTQLGVKECDQLLFSPASPHSLSANSSLSPEQFSELMQQCGASRGNGMLYLLPTGDLQTDEPYDLSCLTQLSESPWKPSPMMSLLLIFQDLLSVTNRDV